MRSSFAGLRLLLLLLLLPFSTPVYAMDWCPSFLKRLWGVPLGAKPFEGLAFGRAVEVTSIRGNTRTGVLLGKNLRGDYLVQTENSIRLYPPAQIREWRAISWEPWAREMTPAERVEPIVPVDTRATVVLVQKQPDGEFTFHARRGDRLTALNRRTFEQLKAAGKLKVDEALFGKDPVLTRAKIPLVLPNKIE